MEKLTLDQLEVENFAMQLSEEELSNLKGGTSIPCVAAAAAVVSAAVAVYNSYQANKSASGNYQPASIIVHTPDSVKVNSNGGYTIYGGQSVEIRRN